MGKKKKYLPQIWKGTIVCFDSSGKTTYDIIPIENPFFENNMPFQPIHYAIILGEIFKNDYYKHIIHVAFFIEDNFAQTINPVRYMWQLFDFKIYFIFGYRELDTVKEKRFSIINYKYKNLLRINYLLKRSQTATKTNKKQITNIYT